MSPVTWTQVAGGSGHTIRNDAGDLAARTGLHFATATLTTTDDAAGDETDVTVANDGHSHTSASVTTHSTAHAHADTTGQTANDHHTQSHNHSAAGDGTAVAPATLTIPGSATPAQTAEGSAVWDSDDDVLTVGDGASRKSLLNKDTLTTKGDLYVATGAAVVTRLGVGSNDQVLTADSAQASGIKWAAAAGGSGDSSLTRFRLAGRYHFQAAHSEATGTGGLAANYLYGVPFYCGAAKTAIAMLLEVTTAAAGSVRMGFYTDNGSIAPGTLLLDAGTVDVSGTGFKTITALSQALSASTLYWLAAVSDVGPTLRCFTNGYNPFGLPATAITGTYVYRIAFTYAALPATFGAASIIASNIYAIGVGF